MKKIILFSIVGLFFGAFATPGADAQSYSARVLSVCPVCHQNVYAYYRPVNYGGVVQYAWVPVYHTQCAARSQTRYITKYHRGTPYNYVVPSHSSHHNHHHHSSHHSGYLSPGFSITIRR